MVQHQLERLPQQQQQPQSPKLEQQQQDSANVPSKIHSRVTEAPRPQLRTLHKRPAQQQPQQQQQSQQAQVPQQSQETQQDSKNTAMPGSQGDSASAVPSKVETVNEKPPPVYSPSQDPKLQQHQQHQQQRQQQQQQLLLQRQQELHKQQQQRQQLQLQNARRPPRKPRSCCYTCCCCCCANSDDDHDDHAKTSAGRNQNTSSTRLSPGPGDDAAHIASLHTRPRKQSRGKQICKKFFTFLFSQVGLCGLVVGYSIMGGFLFGWLESPTENAEKESTSSNRTTTNMTFSREERVNELWNITRELNILYERNWTRLADEVFLRFQDEVYEAVNSGWDGQDIKVDGQDIKVEEAKWSFAGSLLYSITVITTIGYGHITPRTNMGKLATIFYALVGIPLTLLCLSNIGTAFAHCFRFIYYHLCRLICCAACVPTDTSASSPNANGKAGKRRNKEKGGDLSTSTSGGIAPTNSSGNDAGIFPETETSVDMQQNKGVDVQKKSVNVAEVRVPITISLLIMALYIFGGAVLFSLWEEEWSYLIGAYFCFITLSTIGFGDYVFGMGSDFAADEKTIICALYLVMGLSIIAMCFNLMQEEVRAKFSWLGKKLGMLDEEHAGG